MPLNLFSSRFQLEDHPLISAPPRPHGSELRQQLPRGRGAHPKAAALQLSTACSYSLHPQPLDWNLGEKIPVPTPRHSQRMSEATDMVNSSFPCAFTSLDHILPNTKPHEISCSFRDWSCPSGAGRDSTPLVSVSAEAGLQHNTPRKVHPLLLATDSKAIYSSPQ